MRFYTPVIRLQLQNKRIADYRNVPACCTSRPMQWRCDNWRFICSVPVVSMGKCVRTSISIDKKSTIKNERPFDPGHECEIDCIVVLRSNAHERTRDRAVFFIVRISARLRFMSFPHERMRDKFFSTREYPRDCGLCYFRMNEREINIFFSTQEYLRD